MKYNVFITGAYSDDVEASSEDEAIEMVLKDFNGGDFDIDAQAEALERDDKPVEPTKPDDISEVRWACRRKAAELLMARKADEATKDRLRAEFKMLREKMLEVEANAKKTKL